MPRAKNEKYTEAQKLYLEGKKIVEIAEILGIPEGSIRRWKSTDKWDDNNKSERKRSEKGNERSQKRSERSVKNKSSVRKKGGQPGNKNSAGASVGKGNPHPIAPIKHGCYSKQFCSDVFDEEEIKLIEEMSDNEEALLIEQIQLFSVRERRFMQAINKYRNRNEPVAVDSVNRTENKRAFKNPEDEEEYERRQRKKIDNNEILPGNEYSVTTNTENKYNVITRLENELTNIQAKKTRAIVELNRLRVERNKAENVRNDLKEKDTNVSVQIYIPDNKRG